MEDKLIVFDNLMEALKVFMISPEMSGFHVLMEVQKRGTESGVDHH